MRDSEMPRVPSIRITFENEPQRNGSTTTHSPDAAAAIRTLAELLDVAVQRATPTTITVMVTQAPELAACPSTAA